MQRARARRVRLPEQGHLPVTSDLDFVARYYRGPLGFVLRRRLAWLMDALPTRPGAVLDLGCGSGVLMYSLDRAGPGLLVGLDIHPRLAVTSAALRHDGIRRPLVQGDAQHLPFRDGVFDVVVAASLLEFVPDPLTGLQEALRVTAGGGQVLAIVPRRLAWADRLFRLLTGRDPEGDFSGGRERVADAVARVPHRQVARERKPRVLPSWLQPYELITLSRPAVVVLPDATENGAGPRQWVGEVSQARGQGGTTHGERQTSQSS